MAADFHRPNRQLFRHPDWFVALRARLSFGRDLWPRHVRDMATNYADALFSPVMHQTPSGVFLAALRPYVRHCKFSVQHICPLDVMTVTGRQCIAGCPLWVKSGHVQCTSRCPLSANSGHSAIHSITSSARASSAGGMDIPRALAVCKLRASSSRAGCSTGRLPACSPLMIRSTYTAAFRTMI